MIIPEYYRTRSDGVKLIRRYSDAGFRLVRNDGEPFDEAIDIEGSEYTYTESDELVQVDDGTGNIPPEMPPVEPIEPELSAEEALAIILGEAET